MSDLRSTVDFSLIRYANCWEDAHILSQALQVKPGDKVLSIASAGDNSFRLLADDPELVVATDLSQVQLFLVELKTAAIRTLDRADYLAFAGFHPSTTRKETFLLLREQISPEAARYWTHHIEAIERGIIYNGKFERYFQLFASRVLPLIHDRKRIEGLFAEKSASAQHEYYEAVWNNRRWRLLFRIFFSRLVMGSFGRDPAFMREVETSVGSFIFDQAARQLSSEAAQHNFILRFNLTGNFGDELPDYLLPGTYEHVKANLDRLQLFCGYTHDAGERFGMFDKMNLSDIFEYMNPGTFASVSSQTASLLAPHGRAAYWNLMVPRRMSTVVFQLRHLSEESSALGKEDRGFFYGAFIVEEKC